MLDTWKLIVLFYLIPTYRSQYKVYIIKHINEKDVRTNSHLQETEKDLLTYSHKLSSSSGWFSGFILPENFSTSVHCYFWNWLLHSSPCFYNVVFPFLSFLLKTWVLESTHRFQNTKNCFKRGITQRGYILKKMKFLHYFLTFSNVPLYYQKI